MLVRFSATRSADRHDVLSRVLLTDSLRLMPPHDDANLSEWWATSDVLLAAAGAASQKRKRLDTEDNLAASILANDDAIFRFLQLQKRSRSAANCRAEAVDFKPVSPFTRHILQVDGAVDHRLEFERVVCERSDHIDAEQVQQSRSSVVQSVLNHDEPLRIGDPSYLHALMHAITSTDLLCQLLNDDACKVPAALDRSVKSLVTLLQQQDFRTESDAWTAVGRGIVNLQRSLAQTVWPGYINIDIANPRLLAVDDSLVAAIEWHKIPPARNPLSTLAQLICLYDNVQRPMKRSWICLRVSLSVLHVGRQLMHVAPLMRRAIGERPVTVLIVLLIDKNYVCRVSNAENANNIDSVPPQHLELHDPQSNDFQSTLLFELTSMIVCSGDHQDELFSTITPNNHRKWRRFAEKGVQQVDDSTLLTTSAHLLFYKRK